jgi:hypothetical protein
MKRRDERKLQTQAQSPHIQKTTILDNLEPATDKKIKRVSIRLKKL